MDNQKETKNCQYREESRDDYGAKPCLCNGDLDFVCRCKKEMKCGYGEKFFICTVK